MKQVAILKADFETRTVKKTVQGKEIIETLPRFKQGQRFEVFTFDFFWMTPAEKGGLGINLSIMEYLRLTNPDGTPTKYWSLFEIQISTDSGL